MAKLKIIAGGGLLSKLLRRRDALRRKIAKILGVAPWDVPRKLSKITGWPENALAQVFSSSSRNISAVRKRWLAQNFGHSYPNAAELDWDALRPVVPAKKVNQKSLKQLTRAAREAWVKIHDASNTLLQIVKELGKA